MVFLIDDKKSRQADYGWNDDKIASFKDTLCVIRTISELISFQEKILLPGNVVLFHESFSLSVEVEKKQVIEAFEQQLSLSEKDLYVARFSGSKFSRWVEDNSCMLPPSFLYLNLEVFLIKHIEGDTNFMYLAYGNNHEIEKTLTDRIRAVNMNEDNNRYPKLKVSEQYFFALTSEEPIRIPFSFEEGKGKIDESWEYDFTKDNITDINLHDLIIKWFTERQYDCIFIPLCFGDSLSDYLGLRLAMHLRFTNTPNKYAPIIIYGEVELFELQNNDCFDILKMAGVYLSSSTPRSLVEISKKVTHLSQELFRNELEKIHLPIPSNIGNNHSFSNRWAIYRWQDMLEWGDNRPEILDTEFVTSLYFKYLVEKFGAHDRFSSKKKYKYSLDLKDKTIVYIDDEYDKGWNNILQEIVRSAGGIWKPFVGFEKNLSKRELIESIKTFVKKNDADCFIIDLRLHEDDFLDNKNLSGHEIAEYIKKTINEGNQIVVFTASNKVWNLKKEIIDIEAVDYVLKESADLNLKRNESQGLFLEFINAIKLACSLSYLKELILLQKELETKRDTAKQLRGFIKLLQIDKGKRNPNMLNAALLTELVYLEDLILNPDNEGYRCLEIGEGSLKEVELVDKYNNRTPLLGHLFVKRVKENRHTNVIDISDYYNKCIKLESDWSNVSATDVTTVSAVLYLKYHLSREQVQQYVYLKYIRNSQIAHGKGFKTTVTPEMLVKFYKEVIYRVL